MKRRSGFSLIEMVSVLTIGTALMGVAVGLVHQVLTLSNVSKERYQDDRTSSRLAERFREDVYRSNKVESITSNDLKLILRDGTEIEYQITDQKVTCQMKDSRGRVSREDYPFSNSALISWMQLESPTRLKLIFGRRAIGSQEALREERHVIAVLDRYRFIENPVEDQTGESQ